MRKTLGSSSIEVLMGSVLMMLIMLGTMSMMVTGLRYITRSSSDLTISGKNALGLRYISEYARSANTATISNSGSQINFTIPARAGTADSYTGEKELVYPLTWDGITRGFKVDWVAGTLIDLRGNKVIARNIYAKDPDPKSATYGQTYQPFTFSMVGSRKVIVIQLITREKVAGSVRYTRMKNTVLLRNT